MENKSKIGELERKFQIAFDIIQIPVFIIAIIAFLNNYISLHVIIAFSLVSIVRAEYTRVKNKGFYYFEKFNIKTPSVKDGVTTVFAIVLYYIGLVVFSFLQNLFEQLQATEESNGHIFSKTFGEETGFLIIAVYILLFLFVFVPFEEIVFRHKLQKWLSGGKIKRVGIASIVFALLHIPVYTIGNGPISFRLLVPLAVVCYAGIVYGLLYEYTDNLTNPILAHTTVNTVAILFMSVF